MHAVSDSAAAKYVSDDEDADVKEGGSSGRHPSLSGLRGLSEKGSPNAATGRAPFPSTDIAGSDSKSFLFSVNNNPINVERYATFLILKLHSSLFVNRLRLNH